MIGSISLAMAPVVAAATAIQNKAWASSQRCGLRYVEISRFSSGMVAVWRFVGLSKELDTERRCSGFHEALTGRGSSPEKREGSPALKRNLPHPAAV